MRPPARAPSSSRELPEDVTIDADKRHVESAVRPETLDLRRILTSPQIGRRELDTGLEYLYAVCTSAAVPCEEIRSIGGELFRTT